MPPPEPPESDMRTHYCGKVTAADLDQIVTISGWVHRRRDHGGVIFIDLRDREGAVHQTTEKNPESAEPTEATG